MVVISRDFLCEIFKKQIKEKRDDTIKSIDSSLETVLSLKQANKDITFDDLSDIFIRDLSITLTTIENTLKAIYPGAYIPDPVKEVFDEIKNLRYFIGFLEEFSSTIFEYKRARKEFDRWIKD